MQAARPLPTRPPARPPPGQELDDSGDLRALKRAVARQVFAVLNVWPARIANSNWADAETTTSPPLTEPGSTPHRTMS